MSTAQEIADAIVANLSAASALGDRISKTYDIIGRRDQWAAIVELRGCEKFPHQFGQFATSWTFDVVAYVMDTGNPLDVMNRILEVTDKAVQSLESDPTLQGTVDRLSSVTVDREPGEAFEVRGRLWVPVRISITAVSY